MTGMAVDINMDTEMEKVLVVADMPGTAAVSEEGTVIIGSNP